jgi:RNA polymerase-binding transcription factor DksA
MTNVCLKQRFETREACEASIKESRLKFQLYAYLCPNCGGWHKTKKKPRLKAAGHGA